MEPTGGTALPMTIWQVIIAVGLSASCIASLVTWQRARRAHARQNIGFRIVAQPPVIRFGWVAAAATIAEAWVLFMGGYWG